MHEPALPPGTWHRLHALHNAYVYNGLLLDCFFSFFFCVVVAHNMSLQCVGLLFLCLDKVTPTSRPVPFRSGGKRLPVMHVDTNGGPKNRRSERSDNPHIQCEESNNSGAQMEKCYQEYARSVYNTSC